MLSPGLYIIVSVPSPSESLPSLPVNVLSFSGSLASHLVSVPSFPVSVSVASGMAVCQCKAFSNQHFRAKQHGFSELLQNLQI